MSKSLFFLISLLFCSSSLAQEDHYDLLNSLDPAAAPREVKERTPASVEPGQIAVREQLPDAKLQKTARTLQWEVLRNKANAQEESEAEPIEE